MLFVFSFLSKISIYNINNKQLINTINNENYYKMNSIDIQGNFQDIIFVDKNNICYVIITLKKKIISLKYSNLEIYKKYLNYFCTQGIFKYPKVVEFENNIIYLIATIKYDTV